MEEYYKHLETITHSRITPVTTFDRWHAHSYYPNEETCTTIQHDTQSETITFQITTLNGSVFSSTAGKPNETTHYSLNTLKTLNTSFDAIALIGLQWLTQEALKNMTLSPLLYSKTETALTLMNLHYHAEQLQTRNSEPDYYNVKQLKERIPLALTTIKMREKIFLSLNNKILLDDVSTVSLPETWFQKINS